MGIESRRPPPYCTPAMLKGLRALADNKPVPALPGLFESLCSRGWVSRYSGQVTDRGRKYLQEHDKK